MPFVSRKECRDSNVSGSVSSRNCSCIRFDIDPQVKKQERQLKYLRVYLHMREVTASTLNYCVLKEVKTPCKKRQFMLDNLNERKIYLLTICYSFSAPCSCINSSFSQLADNGVCRKKSRALTATFKERRLHGNSQLAVCFNNLAVSCCKRHWSRPSSTLFDS